MILSKILEERVAEFIVWLRVFVLVSRFIGHAQWAVLTVWVVGKENGALSIESASYFLLFSVCKFKYENTFTISSRLNPLIYFLECKKDFGLCRFLVHSNN